MTLPLHPVPAPDHARSAVVASAAYCDGRRVADLPIAETGAWAAKPGHFVWIGLWEPDESLLMEVKRQFALHELAVEDALHAHQRPKLDVYGESLFMVLRTAKLEKGELVLGETHVFAGRGYVVTVRHGASTSYSSVRARAESVPHLLKHGEDFIVYTIMDYVVDCYFPVLDQMAATVDELDGAIREMLETPGPVILDVAVDEAEMCFPMIPGGAAHNEIMLRRQDQHETDPAAREEGMVLV